MRKKEDVLERFAAFITPNFTQLPIKQNLIE
jgi:hypothetical protein